MNAKTILGTFALALCLSIAQPAWGDASGHLKMCDRCHGAEGFSEKPDVPTIGGFSQENAEDALYAYKDGARQCSTAPMMCKLAAKLSEDDIVELATHYAEMPFTPAGEDFDADLAAAGEEIHEENCAKCHGIHEPEEDSASPLHGQKIAYLKRTIAEYRSGAREQLPAMKKKLDKLSDQDIEAILNYYASYRN